MVKFFYGIKYIKYNETMKNFIHLVFPSEKNQIKLGFFQKLKMNDIKDIFISYNWASKKQVKELYKILTENNYKVWMDERDLETSNIPLTAQLGTSIIKSSIFLCCITKDYCKSFNCNLEIEYANSKGKPIVPLIIEKIPKMEEIKVGGRDQTTGIDFIITLDINLY